MYDLDRLKEELERDEGRVKYAYQDSEGYWTIGIGHLIDRRKGGHLPKSIIEALLEYDIKETERELDKQLSFWRSLDDLRQRVILNMAFNLGVPTLLTFKRFIAALKASDWDKAYEEMLDSKWARQVGARAQRLAKIMRIGEEL